jgi:hypothetical protein
MALAGAGPGSSTGGALTAPMWTNIYGVDAGYTNNQTLTGFTGTLSISAANSGSGVLVYVLNGASTSYTGAFTAHPGDVLAWGVVVGLTTMSGTITVTNATTSTTLQAITYTVTSSGGGGGRGYLP